MATLLARLALDRSYSLFPIQMLVAQAYSDLAVHKVGYGFKL